MQRRDLGSLRLLALVPGFGLLGMGGLLYHGLYAGGGAGRAVDPIRGPKDVISNFRSTLAPTFQASACVQGGTTRDVVLTFDAASGNLTTGADCGLASTTFTAAGNPAYSVTAPSGLGTGVTLDGTGDEFASSGDTTGMDITTNDLSFKVWVRSCSVTQNQTIFAKQAKTRTAGYSLSDTAGADWLFEVNDGTNTCQATGISGNPSRDCAWHQITGSWNSATKTCSIQVDGQSAGTQTTAGMVLANIDNALPLIVGAPDTSSDCADAGNLCRGKFSIADLCIDVGGTTTSCNASDTGTNGYATGYDGPKTTANPTFVRATAATQIDQVGYVVGEVFSGVPVYSVGTLTTIPANKTPGILLAHSRTFLDLDNEDLSNAGWGAVAGTPTVTTDTAAAPDGLTTADTVTDDSAAAAEGIVRTWSPEAPTGVTYTASVWMRCEGAAHTVTLQLGGSAEPATTASNTCGESWIRLSTTNYYTEAGTGTISLYATDTTASSTGAAQFWRPEIYAGLAVPLDPAVTSDTAGNADVLQYVDVTFPETGTACAWIFQNWNIATATPPADAAIFSWDSTHQFSVGYDDATGEAIIRTHDLADNASASLGGGTIASSGVWQHLCWSWTPAGTSNLLGFKDGAAGTAASDTFTAGGTYGTTLTFGDPANFNGPDLILADFQLFNRNLSPGMVARLYNRGANTYARAPIEMEEDRFYAWVPSTLKRAVLAFLPPTPPPQPVFRALQ